MDPFVNYAEMREANRQGKILQRLSLERTSDADVLQNAVEELQYKLRQKNMSAILRDYVCNPRHILEIGAGLLDSSGRSFFTQTMPLEHLRKTTYCDSNPQIAEISPEVHCFDIMELTNYFPKEAFSHVIGTNVLDTLDAEDLGSALEQIHSVLMDGGVLVHCLNFEPFLYAFYADISKEPHAIPYLNQNSQHCAIVSEEDGKPLHPLQSIASHLDEGARQSLWQGLLALDNEGFLEALAEKYRRRGGVVIKSYEHYITSLTAACEEAGFRIIACREISQIVETDIPALHGRHILCGPSGVYSEASGSDSGSVAIQTHLFAAELHR